MRRNFRHHNGDASVKYKLTDSKKNKNIMIGDGIRSLISMALNMIKPALPKIASTIGLAGLSTGVTHGINKALDKNKNNIIKLSDKQVNDINNKGWSHIAPSSRLYLVKL